ncbi:hypothetical protein FO519_007578 [Halicephalobus sp. NKZ332]|nr:hypothetical protein FO519_007578 [Halicephalobus sp. NKZ332]
MKFECPICFTSYSFDEGVVCCSPFNERGELKEIHGICVDCIRGFAKSATEDARIARGGVGLPCPVPECGNVLFRNSFEFYLDPDIHMALIERLQHEAIIAAEMDDLVTCPGCQVQLCADRSWTFYDCSCGTRQCRNCPRIYDENHHGIPCSELDELDKQKALEPKLSEITVRVCHRCKLQFVKEDGCNKMECRCGALQCYLCRQPVEDYAHFCECGWKGTSGRCPSCSKSCPLWGDSNERDKIQMEEVRTRFDLRIDDDSEPSETPFPGVFRRPCQDQENINIINQNRFNNNEELLVQKTYEKFNNSIEDLQESIFAIYNLLKATEVNLNAGFLNDTVKPGKKTRFQSLFEACQNLIEVLSSENSDFREKKLAVIRFNNSIILSGNPTRDLQKQIPTNFLPQGAALFQSFNEHAYRITRCRLTNFCSSFSRILEQKEKNRISGLSSGIDVDLYCQLVSNALVECVAQF